MFLGPFFFVTYGYCNAYAARLDFVPSYFAEWQRAIPFMPWLLLPYWTIDAFYVASLLTARDRQELDALGKRLMLATLISCAGFLMFPLRFAFEHPPTSGFNGWLLACLQNMRRPGMVKVVDGLWVGRLPRATDHARLIAAPISVVLDLSAEFDRARLPACIKYVGIPVLDLTAPSLAQLKLAAAAIEHERATALRPRAGSGQHQPGRALLAGRIPDCRYLTQAGCGSRKVTAGRRIARQGSCACFIARPF